jgi:hypothetical protein
MEKQSRRASLIEHIESELKKDAEDIDGASIDRALDGLYALDGLAPPKLSDNALLAAARAVRSRSAWRRGNTLAEGALKRRFARRAVRGVWAACCLLLFTVTANYATTLATGSCLPSKAGIKICCGTKICLCEIVEGEEKNLSHSE